jgi:O-antigen/teichoic acid export membrane protein
MGQSIFSNAVIAATSRVVSVGLGFCAIALTVRIISPESFGKYSVLLTIGTFMQLFADFGLYLTASRELGAAPVDTRSTLMQHIVSLRLALLACFFVVSVCILFLIPSQRHSVILFVPIMIGLVFQSMSQLFMGIFQAYGSIWKATLGDILGRVAQIGILFSLLYTPHTNPLFGVSVAFMVSLCVAYGVHWLLIPRSLYVSPKISIATWKYLIRVSWPIALMLILNVVYFRSDIVILSLFRSAQEVGWYSLAYKMIENGLFFPAMLGGLLLPHMSAAIFQAPSRLRGIISQGLSLSLNVGIIFFAVLVTFAAPIIAIIAGSGNFEPSIALLRVLSVALMIMFMGNIFGFALIALSRQRVLAVLYGFLVVFNISANALLVPSFGAIASAWVTVATEAIAMITAARIVYAAAPYKVPLFSMLFAILGAGVSVYVGSILPAFVHIIFRLIVVAALYVAIGYVGSLWDKKTLSILRTTSSV